MTRSISKTTLSAALLALAAASPLVGGTAAEAKGAKDYFVEEYYFDKPMNGHEGHVGNYYCSYIKQPVETVTASGQKKRVWKLTQTCQ